MVQATGWYGPTLTEPEVFRVAKISRLTAAAAAAPGGSEGTLTIIFEDAGLTGDEMWACLESDHKNVADLDLRDTFIRDVQYDGDVLPQAPSDALSQKIATESTASGTSSSLGSSCGVGDAYARRKKKKHPPRRKKSSAGDNVKK